MITLYLAGPMRGYHLYNSVAFKLETAKLRSRGYQVISPQEMDEQDGVDFSSDETIKATVKKDRQGEPDEDYYLNRDFLAIHSADGLALMEGWEKSIGVAREIATALEADKRIRLIKFWKE